LFGIDANEQRGPKRNVCRQGHPRRALGRRNHPEQIVADLKIIAAMARSDREQTTVSV